MNNVLEVAGAKIIIQSCTAEQANVGVATNIENIFKRKMVYHHLRVPSLKRASDVQAHFSSLDEEAFSRIINENKKELLRRILYLAQS